MSLNLSFVQATTAVALLPLFSFSLLHSDLQLQVLTFSYVHSRNHSSNLNTSLRRVARISGKRYDLKAVVAFAHAHYCAYIWRDGNCWLVDDGELLQNWCHRNKSGDPGKPRIVFYRAETSSYEA
eukprot:g32914.t1